MKTVFLVLSLMFSALSHAGYFVTITQSGATADGYPAVGFRSNCYLTPSMALNSVGTPQGVGWLVTAMDLSSFTANINYWAWPLPVAGTVGSCNSLPLVTGFPQFYSGVSDPAVTSSGVDTGGSSGSSSGVSQAAFDQLRATVTALQTAVTALQSSASSSSQPFDYVMAGVIFSFFFSFTVGVWVVSKNMGLILGAIRRW